MTSLALLQTWPPRLLYQGEDGGRGEINPLIHCRWKKAIYDLVLLWQYGYQWGFYPEREFSQRRKRLTLPYHPSLTLDKAILAPKSAFKSGF